MSSIAILYIVTAIVSITIALLLVHSAKLSGKAKIKADNERRKRYLETSMLIDESLMRTLSKEISEVVDSRKHGEEISKRVSEVFTKELGRRVELNTQELSKKYETIIKEEKQSEEIAWRKYSKVLTDKKETEAVIRSIAEGLVVVDAHGKVIMMNPAAERLLGISKKEKIGKSILDNPKEEQLISFIKSSPHKEDREIELVSRDDETKKVLRASSAVIEDENGKTIGMVSVLSDITKQKELEQLKTNFVTSVSHELRTPLVAMEKSITMILSGMSGPLSQTQKQFLSIAEHNLKRLSLQINDLLDLSKLEAGKMELKCQPSSVEEIIYESMEGFKTWAETKSISLEKEIPQTLPQINIDPNRIIQVLNNLIGNAIKFTPNDGKIVIQARLLREDQGIEVSVADTGIGIAKGDLPKVFDKFYQVGERVSTDISGTGIGLSIAKEIVNLHGGKIWVESEKGAGAKFIFTLPLTQKNGG